ncbi:hypothetical protein BDW74DRAFT_17847 [Aspergillus multicolor]|uniref:uncharacterized protein n=1 Tax=Aspergillus multicolor TaxID=41759 RepID=UPI003CCCF9F4
MRAQALVQVFLIIRPLGTNRRCAISNHASEGQDAVHLGAHKRISPRWRPWIRIRIFILSDSRAHSSNILLERYPAIWTKAVVTLSLTAGICVPFYLPYARRNLYREMAQQTSRRSHRAHPAIGPLFHLY